jgi:hypothetical protein
MLARNGSGPNLCGYRGEAGIDVSAGKHPLYSRSFKKRKTWSLYQGRSRTHLVIVVPELDSPLYRVDWPDIGLSPPANLSRCCDAALAWAERTFLTDHREISVARRLKSLHNFSWSASPVRQNGGGHG